MNEAILSELIVESDSKIVFVVMDGLGGYRTAEWGSELTESNHPGLDDFARDGITGLLDPVAPGITPGSGPGHLGLFGYDPMKYSIGRGALSAAGVGFELRPGDVAARVNFCTIDGDGLVTDRRAGRIPTDQSAPLCELIDKSVKVDGAEVFVRPEKDHRALLVLRGEGLSPAIEDTDPQQTGVAPLDPAAKAPEAVATAEILGQVLSQVRDALGGRDRANFILLRGFDSHVELPSFKDRYGLRALAMAAYPMYIGIARLVGMEAAEPSPSLPAQIDQLESAFADYDFFFFHIKGTDAAGEDGDFERKCAAIEEVDSVLVPALRELDPDVVVVTGDHSTPAAHAAHSWHPVPVLLRSEFAGRDLVERFDEEACAGGAIGRLRAVDFFPVLLSSAGRLAKYGA